MFDSNIGKICINCNIQDYMPFNCNNCNKSFCNACFYDHKCKGHEIVKSIKKVNKKEVCCYNKCNILVTGLLGIECKNCKRKTCAAHRHEHYDRCIIINKFEPEKKGKSKKRCKLFEWLINK